jgi:hypothetical protein
VIPPTPKPKESPAPRRSARLKRGSEDIAVATRRNVKDRWYFEPALPSPKDLTSTGEVSLSNRNVFATQHFLDLPIFEKSDQKATKNVSDGLSSTNHNVSSSSGDPFGVSLPVRSISHVERKLSESYEEPPQDRNEFVWVGARKTLISQHTLRKILAAKETLFKFGTFVPRNESEASRSPEAARWMAGRDLE